MKRFAASLIATILAFTAGLVTASSWSSIRERKNVEPVTIKVHEPCVPAELQPPARTSPTLTVTPPREIDFAQGRLKLVPEQIQLRSESNRYKVDVSYPQITGSVAMRIRKINQHLNETATKLYQWAIYPVNRSLPSVAEASGIYKTVNFTYDVNLATDSYLSIMFTGYSYGSGAHHAEHGGFSVTYDLASGKVLKLSDLFKSGSNYLEFISRYCIDELSAAPVPLNDSALAPQAANFDNWRVTPNGITFDFEACKVRSCAAGDQYVNIPFSALKPFFNAGLPGKFQITYP